MDINSTSDKEKEKKEMNILQNYEKIWKYMSFSEFMSLLHFRELYFCRSDKFLDVFEGKVPDVFFEGWSDQSKEYYIKIHGLQKEHTFLNCWSLGENESYAMWQIYAPKNDGVAVCTTIENLRNSFDDTEIHIDVTKVNYLDFKKEFGSKVGLDETQKDLFSKSFYSLKSKEYEFEKEIRAIYRTDKAEECKLVAVNLDTLIQGVYINPFAEKWFIELISGILERYKVGDKSVLNSRIEVQKIIRGELN